MGSYALRSLAAFATLSVLLSSCLSKQTVLTGGIPLLPVIGSIPSSSPSSPYAEPNLVPINLSRPSNIATYTPPTPTISSIALANWISGQCANSVSQFGIAPGSYSVDSTFTYPSNCAGTTLWTDRVTLSFLNVTAGMVILPVPNVTIRGGIYQYSTPPFSQGHVTAVTANSFSFTVSAGYPLTEFQGPTFGFNIMNPATRAPKTEVLYDYYEIPIAPLAGSLSSFIATLPNPNVRGVDFQSNLQVGDSIVARGVFAYCFYVNGGNDTLADITMYNCAGFGAFDLGPGNDTFRNFNIQFPPGSYYPSANEPPLVTSSADMIHSYARIGPTIDQCHLEGSLDDGIAIHGGLLGVTAASGNQITVPGFTSQYGSDAGAGDTLRVYDDQWVLQGTYIVTTTDATGSIATLDHSLPSGYVVSTWSVVIIRGSHFSVTNNTIGYHRARGVIVCANDGVVQNNVIQGASMAGIMIPMEYDYSSNLSFSGNTVSNSPHAIEMDSYTTIGRHQNISFTQNKISGRDTTGATAETPLLTPLIMLSNIVNLTFTGNSIKSLGYTTSVVQATEVTSGMFAGNCIQGPNSTSITPITLTSSPALSGVSLSLCK